MLTGSLKTLHRTRRLMIGLSLAGPVLALGGAWWLVDRVLLAPAVPDERSSAAECVAFMADAKGLPRLGLERTEKYLLRQARRIVADRTFAERFATAIRTTTPEEKDALQANILGAFKPLLLRDVERCESLDAAARGAFIDERIVHYNHISRVVATSGVWKVDFATAFGTDRLALLRLIMERTTQSERERFTAYAAILGQRVAQILADPKLKAEFEQRIANAMTE